MIELENLNHVALALEELEFIIEVLAFNEAQDGRGEQVPVVRIRLREVLQCCLEADWKRDGDEP